MSSLVSAFCLTRVCEIHKIANLDLFACGASEIKRNANICVESINWLVSWKHLINNV